MPKAAVGSPVGARSGPSRPPAGAASRRAPLPERQLRLLLGVGSLALLLLAWEALGRSSWVDVRFVSRPSLVVAAGYQLFSRGDLLRHIRVSGSEFVLGFVVSIAAGIPLGLLMGWYRKLRLLLEPTVMAFYSVPRTALIPLILVWFGIGLETMATVVFLGAVFPVMVNTMTGVAQVDPSLVRAARSYGAGQSQIFRFVVLPSSLPFIMGGVRLGLGRGLIGVIVGEMWVSTAGIGNLIMTYQSGLNTDTLMLLVFLVALFGVGIIGLARRVEDRLGPWRRERQVA